MEDDATHVSDESHPYIEKSSSEHPILKILSEKLKGKEFSLSANEFVIGRDPAADLVVDDKAVSRRHAVIVKAGDAYVMNDLRSKNGVYVNNMKLSKKVLKSGDVIQIGGCMIQFSNRLSRRAA